MRGHRRDRELIFEVAETPAESPDLEHGLELLARLLLERWEAGLVERDWSGRDRTCFASTFECGACLRSESARAVHGSTPASVEQQGEIKPEVWFLREPPAQAGKGLPEAVPRNKCRRKKGRNA